MTDQQPPYPLWLALQHLMSPRQYPRVPLERAPHHAGYSARRRAHNKTARASRRTNRRTK